MIVMQTQLQCVFVHQQFSIHDQQTLRCLYISMQPYMVSPQSKNLTSLLRAGSDMCPRSQQSRWRPQRGRRELRRRETSPKIENDHPV